MVGTTKEVTDAPTRRDKVRTVPIGAYNIHRILNCTLPSLVQKISFWDTATILLLQIWRDLGQMYPINQTSILGITRP